MPGGDGIGPTGYGPRTGRGLGYCTGYDSPGFTKPGPGMGRGFARGFGRGMRKRLNRRPMRSYTSGYQREVEYNKQDELGNLKSYAAEMKKELDVVMDRIDKLEKK